jgi:hypothetical protein
LVILASLRPASSLNQIRGRSGIPKPDSAKPDHALGCFRASKSPCGQLSAVSRAEAVSAAPRASISGNAFVYRQAPGRGPGMKKKVRGRWHPSPAQVELVIDCLTAKMPLEKAAELLGVGPRTIWIFARRIGRPFPARVGRSRTAETPQKEGGFLMAMHRPVLPWLARASRCR